MAPPSPAPRPTGTGARTAGGGVGFMLAQLAIFLWPSVNGQAWTPEAGAALGGVLTWLGTIIGPWMPRPPARAVGLALVLVAGTLTGCAQGQLGAGPRCSSNDAGGLSDCAAVGENGTTLYMEGGDGSWDPATGVVRWTGAELVQVTHGPAVVTTVAGQDAIGDSIRTLTEGVVKLGAMAAGATPPPDGETDARRRPIDPDRGAPNPATLADR